jgi:hypothetical protein
MTPTLSRTNSVAISATRSLRPSAAVLDCYGSTFDPTEFAQPLHKGGGPLASGRGRARTQEADRRRLCRLLRARSERRCDRSNDRALEKRDEISALHVPP